MSDIETALSSISLASKYLSKANSLEATIEVRDKATAIAAYSRAKGADKAHSLALELKLRAERKAGGFLNDMPKNRGGNPTRTKLVQVETTLKDLGIDRHESSRWQKIAAIPEPKFEEYLTETNKASQSAALRVAKESVASEISGPTGWSSIIRSWTGFDFF